MVPECGPASEGDFGEPVATLEYGPGENCHSFLCTLACGIK